MKFIQRGSRAWQLLTIAVIAVPWLLRDELAVRLDVHTSAAAQVQTALMNESQRAQAAAEQHANRASLRNIEILVMRLARESSKAETDEAKSDLFAESIRREADELHTSIRTFDEHLEGMAIHPMPVAKGADLDERKEVDAWLGIDSIAGGLTKQHLKALSIKVRAVADAVAATDVNATPPQMDDRPIATTALGVAYQALHESATVNQDRYANSAQAARLAAWLFTALGALMIGDWSRTLRGRDTEADAEPGGQQA